MTTETAELHQLGKPFSFPRPPRELPPGPRPLNLPDLYEVFEWAWPLIAELYPRANRTGVRHLLTGMTGSSGQQAHARVWRTKSAVGLFTAAADPFEPRWSITTKFVVHRDDAEDEADAIRTAALAWARSIDAITIDGEPVPAVTAAA